MRGKKTEGVGQEKKNVLKRGRRRHRRLNLKVTREAKKREFKQTPAGKVREERHACSDECGEISGESLKLIVK